MANQEQLAILKQGVEVWNLWRKENPRAKIDLEQADLQGADLRLANLKRANLRQARLSNADLRGARLIQADLREADLMQADLRGADLRGARVEGADMGGADLRGADLIDDDLGNVILLSAFRWKEAKIDFAWFNGKDFRPPKNRPVEDQLNELKPLGKRSRRARAEAGNMPIKLEPAARLSKRGSSPEEDEEDGETFQRNHRDHVYFAVTSLPAVPTGSRFQLAFWMYLDDLREEMIWRAKEELGAKKIRVSSDGPVPVKHGTTLMIKVSIEGMKIDPPLKNILWVGEISKAGFVVSVPPDARSGLHAGLVNVSFSGMQIAQVSFVFEVGDTAASVTSLPIAVQLVRKAFASYASQDRATVLRLVQGMKKILPELDIFVDVMSLRSGDDWEKKLWAVIKKCDVFYLFWSVHAMRSEWVEREWRYAWQKIGLKRIEPVPLVSPKEAPPPPELASKHFNDPVLPYIRAEEGAEHP